MTIDESDEKWFRKKILWCCSDPRYGWSEPEITKELKLPPRINLRELMYSYKDKGWLSIKIDDDDGYWYTTDEGKEQLKSVRRVKA